MFPTVSKTNFGMLGTLKLSSSNALNLEMSLTPRLSWHKFLANDKGVCSDFDNQAKLQNFFFTRLVTTRCETKYFSCSIMLESFCIRMERRSIKKHCGQHISC